MVNDKTIEEAKKKSIVGVAMFPIVGDVERSSSEDSEYDLFANSKYHPPIEEVQTNPKRSETKRVNLTVKQYQKRLVVCSALSAVVALSGLGIGKKAVEKYKNTAIITTYSREFEKDVLQPERHPTLDHMHYYYDYSDIAQKIMASESIDESVYIMLNKIGTEQTNRVLDCTPYKSLDGFLAKKGYSDLDDFKKTAYEMLLLDDEIKKKQIQLDEMNKEHSDASNVSYEDSYYDNYVPYSGGVK